MRKLCIGLFLNVLRFLPRIAAIEVLLFSLFNRGGIQVIKGLSCVSFAKGSDCNYSSTFEMNSEHELKGSSIFIYITIIFISYHDHSSPVASRV